MPKIKILLIEDDPDQIYLYATKFEAEGLILISAKGGAEGIAKAKSDQPDFILCDIVMDDMSGLEALKRIKAEKKTKNIPIAILTNLMKKSLMRQAEEFGAIGFWEKTEVLPDDMVKRIKKILRRK